MVSNNHVVGLISGGKDSLFALHLATYLGYKPIVLGHIRPKDMTNEYDSFMYQTVGSHLIEPIAECLELPLVVRVLQGLPMLKDSVDYEKTEGDEVEDLYWLLHDIKALYPSVTYVSTGAILSDYQRSRVENVCQRLNLISLACLWKLQQSVILQLMQLESDFDALVIKIASMGLTKEDLGKSVRDLTPKFFLLEKQFGFHSCGEGGEYETITLNCPLFKNKCIQIDNWIIKAHSDNDFCPVLYLYPELPISTVPKPHSYCKEECESLDSKDFPCGKLSLWLKDRFSSLKFYMMDIVGTYQVEAFIERAVTRSSSYFEYLTETQWTCEYITFSFWPQTARVIAENCPENVIPQSKPTKCKTSCRTFSFFPIFKEEVDSRFSIDATLDVKTHPGPLSLSFWRSCLSTHESYHECWILNDKLLITNWINSSIPHLNQTPESLWCEVLMTLRNLRNLLRDYNTSMRYIEFLDVCIAPDWDIPMLSQILSAVLEWNFSHLGVPEKEIDQFIKRREALLWTTDFDVLSNSTNFMVSPLFEKIIQSSPQKRFFRIWKTKHKDPTSHIALRVIAGIP